LYNSDVITVFEQLGGEVVAKSIAACRLRNPCPPNSLSHRLLDYRPMLVVAMANSEKI
jgi:hypothetical protein